MPGNRPDPRPGSKLLGSEVQQLRSEDKIIDHFSIRNRTQPRSSGQTGAAQRRAEATQRQSGAVQLTLILPLLLLAISSLYHWYSLGRPVNVAELAPTQNSAGVAAIRLECVSYAPFRLPGESPFNLGTRVSPARLEADLKLLAASTECVRIYSVQQGLDAVPEIARRLGLKVFLGAWIGRDRAENEAELNIAFDLSRRYPDVVRALIVGNEVLLRRELAAEVIAHYLERARAAVKVPVTYADVWEFWIRNPALASQVNFATIHILPYWEDDPVPIQEAVPHVLNIVRHVREKMPGVELMIGETGWPSQGRARHGAVPSLVNQARFAREFAIAAPQLGVPYNFIEGFDQPWKRRLEGAMGGYWGLFDSAGKQKFPIRGDVIEDVQWQRGWVAAVLGAIAALLLVFGGRRYGERVGASPNALAASRSAEAKAQSVAMPWAQAAMLAVAAGISAGAVVMAQWSYMTHWNRTWLEWSVTAGYTLAALSIWVMAVVLASRSSTSLSSTLLSAADSLSPAADSLHTGFAYLRLFLLFGAAVMMVLLAFDARYRGFPWPLYCLPTVSFLILVRQRLPFWRAGLEERMLASVIVLGSVAVACLEGWANIHALTFVALMIAMASLAVRADYRWLSVRTKTSAPVNAPTAANS